MKKEWETTVSDMVYRKIISFEFAPYQRSLNAMSLLIILRRCLSPSEFFQCYENVSNVSLISMFIKKVFCQ